MKLVLSIKREKILGFGVTCDADALREQQLPGVLPIPDTIIRCTSYTCEPLSYKPGGAQVSVFIVPLKGHYGMGDESRLSLWRSCPAQFIEIVSCLIASALRPDAP